MDNSGGKGGGGEVLGVRLSGWNCDRVGRWDWVGLVTVWADGTGWDL